MRKILLLGAAAATLTFAAASAQATEFKGSVDVAPQVQAPNSGLVVNVAQTTKNFDFTLTPDNPKTKHKDEAQTTLKLFTLYTNETSLNSDDLAETPIDLTFNFTLPTPNSGPTSIDGDTSGQFELFGFVQAGVLTWTDSQVNLFYGPTSLPQADKGDLQITVNGGAFNEGLFGLDGGKKDGLVVSATFDWLQDPILNAAGSVPEPTSWALMIGGFGLTGAMLRRRRSAAVAA
jgi:PEP-CTERM motif